MGAVVRFPQRPAPDGGLWENYVTESHLACHFGVSSRTVRRWSHAGMPSRRLGGCRRYRISEAEAWLAEREATTR